MSLEGVRVTPEWLSLREPADAGARARDLGRRLAEHLAPRPRTDETLVIHDLGAGTGSMGRWLAPQLPGPQHWVLHDRDPDLLDVAATDRPGPAADGGAVTVEARRSDIAGLSPGALAGASVVTASALLDMLTEPDLTELVASCSAAACPVLLTLSVNGHVGLSPVEPFDSRLRRAFNDHQRRGTAGERLLGPDAFDSATASFQRLGAEVHTAPSPWRLGPADHELIATWLTGWVAAACQQDPSLAADAGAYTSRRLAQLHAGQLLVTVWHSDLLALPAQQSSAKRDDSA
ncbi:MAG TPA: class I SAM-dependent methyltransferase [Solirubrobacteraceae bacterium]|nr:class I SAM-dependent methyltransferase [Solirubrobacteraceae bacterium]